MGGAGAALVEESAYLSLSLTGAGTSLALCPCFQGTHAPGAVGRWQDTKSLDILGPWLCTGPDALWDTVSLQSCMEWGAGTQPCESLKTRHVVLERPRGQCSPSY